MSEQNPTPNGVNDTSPRNVRLRAEKTQIQVCSIVPCSPLTIRLYEANPNAVSKPLRRKLDGVYAEMARAMRTAA